MRIILAILIWVAAASLAPAAITVTPGGGGGVITTNEFDGSAITSGTVADARIASTIARDSEVPAIMATNRAADLVDADTYIGAYYIWNQEKIYVTHGNLTSQRVIGYYNPPTPFFSDPVIWYNSDHYYVAHTLRQFAETNKFAIVRSDSSLADWEHVYNYDCSSASNQLGGAVRTCWSPRGPLIDTDGSYYMTISLSTNSASAAGMRLFVTRALDNTFTNWSPLVMLTNSLDIDNYAGMIYKSNNQYQVWTKRNGQFMEIHVATNIYGPWSAYKTGNWVTWAGPHEQAQPIRDSRGRWTVLLSNGGEFKQYYVCATNDNLDAWSTAKAMENSLDTMNGGVWPVTGKNPIGAMTYSYYNGSNATTGHRFVTGKVTAGGPGNTAYTVYHAGGTDTWLALKGSISTGIGFDPETNGTVDFYIAGRLGSVASTYMKFTHGTQNVSWYGGMYGNGLGLTNTTATNVVIPVSTTGYNDVRFGPSSTIGFYSPNVQMLGMASGGADVLYMGGTTAGIRFLNLAPATILGWGATINNNDVAFQRNAAGEIGIYDGSVGTIPRGIYRDLKARTVTSTNLVLTSVAIGGFVQPASGGVSLVASNGFLFSIHNVSGTFTTNLLKSP